MTLGEVAVLGRLLQDRTGHGAPPLDRRLVWSTRSRSTPAIMVVSIFLFASWRRTVARVGRLGLCPAASGDMGRLRRMVGGLTRISTKVRRRWSLADRVGRLLEPSFAVLVDGEGQAARLVWFQLGTVSTSNHPTSTDSSSLTRARPLTNRHRKPRLSQYTRSPLGAIERSNASTETSRSTAATTPVSSMTSRSAPAAGCSPGSRHPVVNAHRPLSLRRTSRTGPLTGQFAS